MTNTTSRYETHEREHEHEHENKYENPHDCGLKGGNKEDLGIEALMWRKQLDLGLRWIMACIARVSWLFRVDVIET